MNIKDPLTFQVFNEIGIINQLTSTLARMEKAGLVVITADPKDGRVKLDKLRD
ncbi:hypothetical protein [Parasphingorhabdus sp.]|uniref:hypothetical protein n=1 Tax=Parasphingorhabdus sp. TaxID=2709688 RepID=UPI0032632E5D